MNDETMARIYFIAYFWLLVAVQTLLVMFGTELESPRGTINTGLTYMAFVPFFGYIYDKVFSGKNAWRLIIFFFLLWQILGYTWLYDHPGKIKVMQLFMMAPFYWGLVMYAWITMEEDEEKKAIRLGKIKDFEQKFRSIRVIICAFAFLLLALSLFVMITARFNSG